MATRAEFVDSTFANATTIGTPPEMPMGLQVLEDLTPLGHWPLAWAWQSHKGANTILRGGWDRASLGVDRGMFRNFGHQNVNPRSWNRYADLEPFRVTHNPISNQIFNADKGKPGWLGRMMERRAVDDAGELTRMGRTLADRGVLDAAGGASRQLWDGKFLSRIRASMRAGRGFSPATMRNSMSFIEQANPQLARGITRGGDLVGTELSHAIGMSGRGVFSSRLAGYMGRAQGPLSARMESLGTRYAGEYMRGAAAYERHLALGQGARFAVNTAGEATVREVGSAGLRGFSNIYRTTMGKAAREAAAQAGEKVAVRVGLESMGKYGAAMAAGAAAGPVGWAVDVGLTAWMVKDLVQVGSSLGRDLVVKPVVNNVREGFKSFKGQIDKPMFGMGFVDNEVAATSRARGVQAIQNSRLNARSVLGNEASMLHAHFG